jgi:hypothetical protein
MSYFNPAVDELTPADEVLREFLIDMATRRAAPMSYGVMGKAVDPDGRLGLLSPPRSTSLITALYHVNADALYRGEPMVGALAVSKTTGNSGKGFADVAREQDIHVEDTPEAEFRFWQDQLQASYDYDWAGDGQDDEDDDQDDEDSDDDQDDGTGLSDEQFAALMTKLDSQFTALVTELVAIKKLLRRLVHT